jgi:hypothetical protein
MPGKLVPKVILEGTRLTHKTDLAFALNEHPGIVGPRRYRYHSPLISAEWSAFDPEPWGRGLINYAPDEEPLALETYATWLRLFELQRWYSWIVDRFHLSTRAHQRLVNGRDPGLVWLDRGLADLGFRLVLCTRREGTFERAREARLKVSGQPSQYDDLRPFLAEQALLRELAQDSALPTLELDLSDDDVAGAADRVASWLAATGGRGTP